MLPLSQVSAIAFISNYKINFMIYSNESSDKKRIQQLLFILITNALKYTNEGYIKVSATKIFEGYHTYIKFKVKDTGYGMK